MQKVKGTSGNSSDDCTAYEYYGDKGLLKAKKELYNLSNNTSPVVTQYEYDSFGRLLKTIHPDQTLSFTETTFAGTAGGQVPSGAVLKVKKYTKTLSNQEWGVSISYFDRQGNELRSVAQNLSGTYIYADQVYDEYNRLVEAKEPYFAGSSTNLKTSYTYDALGRVLTVTAPDGTITRTTYKGRRVKTKNMTSKVWTEKKLNALGLVDLVIDTLGSLDASAIINNNYDGLGRQISTVAFYNTTSFEYDAAGNQSKLIDPNAGTSIYTYNAFGELITQQDARGNTYQMVYDGLGRIQTKSLTSGGNDVTTYTYNNTVGTTGFGQLQNVARSNGTSQAFTYDNLGRILTKTEIIDGNSYTFAYTYNASTGMLETYEYPSGYKLKYLYDSRGNQHEVRTADAANTLLWKANAENQRGQLTQATMGNGTITDYEWDTYGFPQRNKVSKGSTILQNLTFSFNSVTGNLNARSDAKRNILETFDYDNLLKDRLISWSASGGATKTMTYEANGNITKKTDVSLANNSYKYQHPQGKPNAVTGISSPTSEFLQNGQMQDVTYTPFNKVEHILNSFDLGMELLIVYGPDNKRKRSIYYSQAPFGPPIKNKHYLQNYEIEIQSGTEKQLHYLQGSNGLFAIMVKQGTSQTMCYVHKDYLGSLTAISDATGNLVESLRSGSLGVWESGGLGVRRLRFCLASMDVGSGFDERSITKTDLVQFAAGTQSTEDNCRNPDNRNDYNVTSTMFDRGFTGHACPEQSRREHLPQFGLINMNGRVYDPFLARFLSPDPRVSNPENGQNFNRYSYALNNPFKYTDPDGEHPLIIAAALIGGGFNMISNWQNISKNPWSAIGYFASGAVGGIVAISNPHLGGTIAATGNVATDIAFGNIPDFKKPMDVIQYVGFKALDGLGAASAPKIARSVLNASWLSRNSYKMGGVQYELLAESADEIAYTANISSEVTVLAQKTYTFDGVANSALKLGKNVIAGADEIGNAAKSVKNLVYQGVDKTGVVRYVGITEREAVVRFGEHLSSGTAKSFLRYEVVPGATNLSRTGARVWEQTLINQYGLQKNGGLLLNKINSIAPKNWWQHGINL